MEKLLNPLATTAMSEITKLVQTAEKVRKLRGIPD